MLNWALPGLLSLAFLLLPVAFFYFLRQRFRQQPVSSLYLWSRFLHPAQRGNKLRRRSLLLLALQVMAVAAVTVAAAEPFWFSRQLTRPGTVYLIDTSASMAAIDESWGGRPVSRVRAACEAVKREIRQLPPDAAGMIFLCGATATPLGEPTVRRAALLQRLEAVRAGAAEFREAEVSEALKTWINNQRRPWRACLISDGGLSLGGTELAAVFNHALRGITVGRRSDNLGITALRLSGREARFNVINGWPVTRRIRVGLWLKQRRIGGVAYRVAPGISSGRLRLAGGALPGVYRAVLEGNRDAAPLDDACFLAWNPVRRFRILQVGPGNPFLNAALRNPLYDVTAAAALPPDFHGAAWDLIIARRADLPAHPGTNVFSFGSGTARRRLADSPGRVGGGLVVNEMDHPLLRYFDPDRLWAADSAILPVDSRTLVLATIDGHPVLTLTGGKEEKQLNCGFDLPDSNLGLSGAFPVLLQNLLQWVVPQGGNPLADTLAAGEESYRAERADWMLVSQTGIRKTKDGPLMRLIPVQPGVYRWRQGGATGYLAVNPPASELDLTPQPLRVSRRPVHLGAAYAEGRKPLANWFLALFFCFITAEWLVWRGGWRKSDTDFNHESAFRRNLFYGKTHF